MKLSEKATLFGGLSILAGIGAFIFLAFAISWQLGLALIALLLILWGFAALDVATEESKNEDTKQ